MLLMKSAKAELDSGGALLADVLLVSSSSASSAASASPPQRRRSLAASLRQLVVLLPLLLLLLLRDLRGDVHLEDGVLAEVDEHLHLLRLAALVHHVEDELALGLPDLRHLPLLAVHLADLKVDALDLAAGAHDLDAAEEGPEVVEDALRLLQEVLQPRVVRHVLRQVGEQHGDIEADVFGGLLEAVGELVVVDHVVLVGLGAGQQELDLGGRVLLLAVHGLLEVLLGDEATRVGDVVAEGHPTPRCPSA